MPDSQPPGRGASRGSESLAVHPAFRRRALERWDRILLAHESLHLLASCRPDEELPEPARVLEVGCRTGLGSRFWLRRGTAALTAVDVSTERLVTAAARSSAPLWLRRDPRYLSGTLPGAPFGRIIVYPWVVGSVRPERLEGWLRDLAALLSPGARAGQSRPRPERRPAGTLRRGRLDLVLYRQAHLARTWGHEAGGRDTGVWAWAWEGSFDPRGRKQELHLLAFLPSATPGRFIRMDEVVTLYAHPQESFADAARAAGLSGGERAAARTRSLLLYQLTRVNRPAR